jgi:hypothetical protein
MRSSQRRIGGRYLVVLASTGADNKRVVGLHGDDPPELFDRVGVRIAVRCGVDVPGVWSGVERTFLLSVNHYVTGVKTAGHALLLYFPLPEIAPYLDFTTRRERC